MGGSKSVTFRPKKSLFIEKSHFFRENRVPDPCPPPQNAFFRNLQWRLEPEKRKSSKPPVSGSRPDPPRGGSMADRHSFGRFSAGKYPPKRAVFPPSGFQTPPNSDEIIEKSHFFSKIMPFFDLQKGVNFGVLFRRFFDCFSDPYFNHHKSVIFHHNLSLSAQLFSHHYVLLSRNLHLAWRDPVMSL